MLSPPPFSSPTHHFPSYCVTVFTLFGSFVTLSSRHPSRATWTRRLGCLGRMCSLPPPSFLPDVLNLQPFKLQAVCTLSARHPSQATLACCLGHIGGGARGFLPPGVTRDPSVLDFAKACLASFFGAVGFSVSF